ncbi:MAG: hypothetical protein LWX83_15735, partial [Anaerolineae bacterium]|nr:hypothetical protein [Anaerolineae bacterium]
MNHISKKYILQSLGLIALYITCLVVAKYALLTFQQTPWIYLFSLLPVLPICLGLVIFLRFFNELDELQKRIQLHALAFSFGITGTLSFTYGLLQNVGLPQISLISILPLMIVFWGIGYMFAERR